MNPRVLGVVAGAGLLVVGFAIFIVSEPREPREKRSLPGKASTSKMAPGDKEKPRQRAEPPPSLRPRTPISRDEEPEPEEEPTLEDARKEFDALIADLDREVARLEKSGGKLTEAEYTQYRTRGANAIDAVLRRLDHKDPNMMIEIKAKQEAARSRLDKLEP